MHGRGALAIAIAAWSAAPAAAGPLYRDPPDYRGVKTAPKTAAAPLPQAPPALTLAANGSNPDILVDEAGTAHVVYNIPGGELPDSVGYCRIKRGASACDAAATLQSEITPADPNARYDDASSLEIVRVGEQLLVFSKRYPIVREKPDGASSSTIIAWASGDGGTTWTQTPTTVGKHNLDDAVALGGAEDAAVLAMGIDPLCGAEGPAAVCLSLFRSGQYAAEEGNLSPARDANYEPNLVVDENGMPVLSVEDLAYDTYVRRWRGTGSPLDPAQWTTPTVIPADQGSLAGGPAGVYLMAKPKTGGRFSVSRLNPQGEGYTLGAGRAITPESDSVLGELHQGPSGRLVAAWSQRDKGLLLRETSGAAGARPSFGPAKTLSDGAANGQIAIGSAADGGGFTVFNHTGGVVGDGEIRVAGFGTQLATGQPGIADVAGGGLTPSGSCGELSFGSFTAETAEGCLLKGKGERKDEYVTDGEMNLWGVRIVPDAGTKIIINPKTLELNTTGDVRVMVTAPAPVGDVVLFHGRIQRDLSKVVPGTPLFEFPSGPFKASLLGFDIGAGIDVRLEKDGVHIPIDLSLPPVFGGFTGHAELVADRETGLHVDSVKVHIGPVPLGALIVNSVDLEYRGGEDLWMGAGSITVPPAGTLDLSAAFQGGTFKSATFVFKPGQPIPIGPFVYLLDFGGGFFLDPVQINMNATVGAGAAAAGEAPVKVHGDLTMTFPPSGPASFEMKGTVGVFMFDIAEGRLLFQTDGYASFDGHAGVNLGPLEADVDMDGFIDATDGQWGSSLSGRVALCVVVDVELDEIRVCGDAQASAAVSTKGFAACARINPPDPVGGFEVGLTYPWSDWNPAFLVNPVAATASVIDHLGGCHVEEYRIVPPRGRAAQAGGAFTVAVPGGLPSRSILLQGGSGGRPRVSVTGPDGQPTGTTVAVEGGDATYVLLDEPAAGDYTITPREGSPPVAQVLTADGYEPARVNAKLGGKGRRRAIRYTLTHMGHGQSVAFQERGRFGTHVLGTAKGARGTLRFRPADAAGGRRTVEALIRRDGIVTDVVRVGSYVAPGPERPGRVRRLRGQRRGNSLVVRWAATRGAARYAVTVTGARGTRLGAVAGRRARSATFGAVRADERVTVRVRALSAKGRQGPATVRRLPASG